MNLQDTLKTILEQEQLLNDGNSTEYAIPENCYLLDDDMILCRPRSTGDSRYPYSVDGFTLWAYSSGYMSLNESTFYYILPASEGKEPYLAFFGGIETDGKYFPISITGVARQPLEKNVKRFTVYTPQAVYYVTKTPEIAYAVRAYVSKDKKAVFSVIAQNLTDKPIKAMLSSFFNCLLMHQACENVETKWFKQCKVTDNGFIFESVEDLDRTTHLINFGIINRNVNASVDYAEHTTSRSDYVGAYVNSLVCATPLFTGHFEKQAKICKFDDTASAGDIFVVQLKPNGVAVIDYVAECCFDPSIADSLCVPPAPNYADDCVNKTILADKAKFSNPQMLKMNFGEYTGEKLNGKTLTKFVKNVVRQVEFAALAKNSGVSLLGVRDVVQQIEAALMWNAKDCRKKLLELLNFIDPSGRPPRQYSIPAKNALPQMDTRAFIDQGNWIISAFYTYLAFTGDYSILDEICGYYKIVGRNKVQFVEERNSVAEHLYRIMDYLIVNIDDSTNCLRALYGDWNDALDGLGVSTDPTKEFGSGVSVMASLHFYKNLNEMLEIIDNYGDKFNQKQRYSSVATLLKNGLEQYAIQFDSDGSRRILHGWGDNRNYLVGSNCDIDGNSRDGLAANAFWVISGMYQHDKTIKNDILAAYKRLDSKYGLRTFNPYFAPGTKGVGRIVNLPKGTAENAATYVHATMFGIWSLFAMNESKLAFEQLTKVLPLTHDLITTTPFIMSNSYSYNEELNLDGGSMSDWFTGSANVLIKTLVWYVFGIHPDLNGVTIAPSIYFPFKDASITIKVKDSIITLKYQNKGEKERNITVNGKPYGKTAYLTQNDLLPNIEILVCD